MTLSMSTVCSVIGIVIIRKLIISKVIMSVVVVSHRHIIIVLNKPFKSANFFQFCTIFVSLANESFIGRGFLGRTLATAS